MNLQITPRSATDNNRTLHRLYGTLPEQAFQRMISLESRRANRSSKSFLLMLIELGHHGFAINQSDNVSRKTFSALSTITRETDVTGWYREGVVLGVLFTEVAVEELSTITTAIMGRVSRALRQHLNPQQFSDLNLSFQVLPEGHQQFSNRALHSTVSPVVHSSRLAESAF